MRIQGVQSLSQFSKWLLDQLIQSDSSRFHPETPDAKHLHKFLTFARTYNFKWHLSNKGQRELDHRFPSHATSRSSKPSGRLHVTRGMWVVCIGSKLWLAHLRRQLHRRHPKHDVVLVDSRWIKEEAARAQIIGPDFDAKREPVTPSKQFPSLHPNPNLNVLEKIRVVLLTLPEVLEDATLQSALIRTGVRILIHHLILENQQTSTQIQRQATWLVASRDTMRRDVQLPLSLWVADSSSSTTSSFTQKKKKKKPKQKNKKF